MNVSVTLRQLEAVRKVARLGTIAAAAKVLYVTPAALTTRIKLLERELGVALFDRVKGRLLLTSAGEEFVAAATRIDNVMIDLTGTLEKLKGLHGGRVRVGAVSTAKYFAPRLMAAFRQQHAAIDFRLAVGNRTETIAALRNYDIDIALMGRPPLDFAVESQSIGPHPHVIIAPADHPLASRRRIAKTDLAGHTFLVREEGSGTRSLFESFFGGIARGPKVDTEIGSNETIKQAVIAGLGLSLISAHTIAAEVSSGRLVVLDVEGLPIVREWFTVHRTDRPLQTAAQALWAFLVKEGNSFLP